MLILMTVSFMSTYPRQAGGETANEADLTYSVQKDPLHPGHLICPAISLAKVVYPAIASILGEEQLFASHIAFSSQVEARRGVNVDGPESEGQGCETR